MAEAMAPVLRLFEETGAYLKGHFRLTSGMHSPEYLQSALVLQHPGHAERLGAMLAGRLRELAGGAAVATVMAPALGGLIIGHEVARAMGARFLFTERDASGKMTLRRGFTLTPGETVVVVEDVVTTGGSLGEVIEMLAERERTCWPPVRSSTAAAEAPSWACRARRCTRCGSRRTRPAIVRCALQALRR